MGVLLLTYKIYQPGYIALKKIPGLKYIFLVEEIITYISGGFAIVSLILKEGLDFVEYVGVKNPFGK